MQNSFIIFQKLLVLFGFMLIGYLSYKKNGSVMIQVHRYQD